MQLAGNLLLPLLQAAAARECLHDDDVVACIARRGWSACVQTNEAKAKAVQCAVTAVCALQCMLKPEICSNLFPRGSLPYRFCTDIRFNYCAARVQTATFASPAGGRVGAGLGTWDSDSEEVLLHL